MAGFAARWLGDSVRLGLGLAAALAAMQVPAVTAAYDAALVQVAEEGRRDIARRQALARGYYNLPEGTDAALIEALRPREPANAQGLESSAAREGVLRDAHARLAAAPALLRPLVAAWDLTGDPFGNKRAILGTALGSHVPQVILGTAAATWALAGLVLGLLVANLALAPFGAASGARARRPA